MAMFPWYYIMTIILTLVFLTALLILAIRTKSIGIGLIFVSLLFGHVLNWVFLLFLRFFMDNIMDNINIGDMNPVEIISFLQSSVSWFILITCTIGVFLIYNEWKRGKFQPPQSENRYQLHN